MERPRLSWRVQEAGVMRDPRRSTAIVPRSLPRTTALRPAGSGFAGKVFVPERRVKHVSFGGRTIMLIRDIELGRDAPEALKIVVAAGLLAEKALDEAARIEEGPICGGMFPPTFGRRGEILCERLRDFCVEALPLPPSEGAAG